MGFLRVLSAEETLQQMDEAAGEESSDVPVGPVFTSQLARYVHDCFEEAKRARAKVDRRLRRAYLTRIGEYEEDILAEIEQVGGSKEYARIVANKSRILESWLKDVLFGGDDLPWSLAPTEVPNLGDDILKKIEEKVDEAVQRLRQLGIEPSDERRHALMEFFRDAEIRNLKVRAKDAAERMRNKIKDQFQEGGLHSAMDEFITTLAMYPAAILKGPVVRRRKRLVWEHTTSGVKPKVQHDIVLEFDHVHPARFYPAPDISSVQEGYVLEHIVLTTQQLQELMDAPGYDTDEIAQVLAKAADGYRWVHGLDTDGTSSSMHTPAKSGMVDVMEFHGPVLGQYLKDWGLNDSSIEPNKYYEAVVWLVDTHVIKAVLNADIMGRRPYYVTSYEKIPGEFWGLGPADILADVQGVANAAVRSLVNNMALSSGPQVVVDIDALPPGEDITSIYPWKIWQVSATRSKNGQRPIDFFQPNANVQPLMMVLEKFYQLADDFSLVPRYMAGSDKASGAARTASGLSMLLDAANKGLKSIILNIDNDIIKPLVERMYRHNMQFSDDPTIKGDVQVVAHGVTKLIQEETVRMRRNEFLQITANPVDSQIVGPHGRAVILREIAKDLGLDVESIIPSTVTGDKGYSGVLAEMMAELQANAGIPPTAGQTGVVPETTAPQGSTQQASVGNGEVLSSGVPVTDVAGPQRGITVR